MADFFDKELLSLYVITLKLTEIVHTTLLKRQSNLTLSSNSLTPYESDPELDPVSLAPPPPPSLDSPWIIYIREKLDQARRYKPSSHLSIYRVPKCLRNVDEIAYTPQIVSLGPYHSGCRHLHDMNIHKWRALDQALFRSGHDVRLYFDAAHSLKDRARACYEAPLSISTDAFVESLVLDSVFVIELFRGFLYMDFTPLGYAPNDPVFGRNSSILSLQFDMLKLENQLPMFVLERIYALQLGHNPTSGLVARLALNFFHSIRPSYETVISALSFDPLDIVGKSRALHCLDLFRRRVLLVGPKPTSRFQIKRPHLNIHCVTKLLDAGIKFRRRKSDLFWDIRFKDGVLHIPSLFVQDCTKSIFLNLIAFEQCHVKCSSHIISYVILMDNLINTEVDVGHLHSKGIIKSCLGTDGDVANLFNQLFKEVVFDENDYYFSELAEQVNHHCNRRWNAWRANLILKYLSNPWTITSLVAAVVLLLLTFGQTFYSIFGYYKPI